MNLNLISPSGSQKSHSDVTRVEKSGNEVVTDPSSEGSSDSFLSKLAALFGGNSSENAEEAKAVAADADSSVVHGLQPDEMDGVEDGSESQLTANVGDADVDELLETGKAVEVDDPELMSDAEKGLQDKNAAEQVVGEGLEVLSRLKTASQQLIQKDGKELPASDDDQDDSLVVPPGAIQNQQMMKVNSETAEHTENTDEKLLTSGLTQTEADSLRQMPVVAGAEGQAVIPDDAVLAEVEKLKALQKESALQQPLAHVHRGQTMSAHMLAPQGNPQSSEAAMLQQGTLAGQKLDALQAQTQQNVSAASQAGADFSKQWTDKQALNALNEKKNSVDSGIFAGGHGESVAQHLSSVTGQMGQLRAEQVQNQSPVYINKDIAADQLSERINMMMSKNLKNIDIRLDPPELGRMHIRMHMAGDQATVHFTVANNQARDVIEHTMGRLRDMLTQQGVQLGETSVQHQGANQQQGYAASGNGHSADHASSQLKDSGFAEDNPDTGVKLDLNVTEKRDGISYYA